MRSILCALALLALTACANSVPIQSQIGIDGLAAYRAAVETAATVVETPGLSARAVADVQAAETVATAAVLATVDGAQSGLGLAVLDAAMSVPSAVQSVQAALSARHGDTVISAGTIGRAAITPGITMATTLALEASGGVVDTEKITAAINAAHARIQAAKAAP